MIFMFLGQDEFDFDVVIEVAATLAPNAGEFPYASTVAATGMD